MLDLLKENLRGKNNHPHHYQTHDLLPRKVRVHEDGVTYQLLNQCFGTFGAFSRDFVQLAPCKMAYM
jgi:hypothetical protein